MKTWLCDCIDLIKTLILTLKWFSVSFLQLYKAGQDRWICPETQCDDIGHVVMCRVSDGTSEGAGEGDMDWELLRELRGVPDWNDENIRYKKYYFDRMSFSGGADFIFGRDLCLKSNLYFWHVNLKLVFIQS